MVCAQVMGNNFAITLGGMNGHFQLNVYKPLIIRNVLHSLQLLRDGTASFLKNCLKGLQPNLKVIQQNLEKSLMLVTALNPHIGYDNSAKIAKFAHQNDLSLKEAAIKLGLISEKEFDNVVQAQHMVNPMLYKPSQTKKPKQVETNNDPLGQTQNAWLFYT